MRTETDQRFSKSMPEKYVNLIKLCVGTSTVESLEEWQSKRINSGDCERPEHVTRMRPKRAEEILNGGSLYWVIRGHTLARQRIIDLERRLGSDGIMRCAIIFDPEIVRTVSTPRRPFRGWRYLEADASPPDRARRDSGETDLPDDIAAIIAEFGVI